MPNPDGSPTIQEIIAANPGMAPGAPPAPQEPQILSASLPPERAGTPSLQDQLASFGVGTNAPPPAQAQPQAQAPQYATKLTPGQISSLSLPSNISNQLGAPALPQQPTHGEAAQNGAAKPSAPITYKPTLQAQTAAGGKGADAGFFVPRGAGGGGAPGPAANPFANQLQAAAAGQQNARATGEERQADSQFNREMLDKDIARVDAETKKHEMASAINSNREQAAKQTYDNVLKDKPHESIDNNRWWSGKSTGQKIGLAISAALQGFANGYSGRGGSNQTLDMVQNAVSEDIASQKAEMAQRGEERGRQIEGAKTAYDMIRQGVHDDQAAEDLTHAFVLERGAAELKQRALLSQDVETRASARDAVMQWEQRAAEMRDKAAMAQRAGAAGFDRNQYIKLVQENRAKGDTLTEAETNAARVMGYTNRIGNNATLENTPGGARSKLAETQTAVDEVNKQFGAMLKSPAIESGPGTAILSKLGSQVAPESAHTAQELDGMNNRMLGSIAKFAKDAEGKPNKAMIDEFRETYFLHPSESPEMKRQKIMGAQQYINNIAKQQGASAPEAPAPLINQVAGFRPAGQ